MGVASCDVCGSEEATMDVQEEYKDYMKVICFKCNEEVIELFNEITKDYNKAREKEKLEELELWLFSKGIK